LPVTERTSMSPSPDPVAPSVERPCPESARKLTCRVVAVLYPRGTS
jgi:hypothetical protein